MPASSYDFHHSGQGPRLLLLHSGFCTWVEWRRTIELLERDFEILAPTQPGSAGGPPLELTGRTMLEAHADHVEELLDELGWDDPVTVVGSSFGGVLGIELANRGRAAQVIALAPPWVAPPDGFAFYLALFSPLIPLRFTRRLWPTTTRIGAINGLFFHTSTKTPEMDPEDVATILGSMSRFPFLELRRNWRTGPGMPEFDGAGRELTTLVWGTADYYVPRWMRRRWEASLPEAARLELPGFPHQPHLRDPQRIAELVATLTVEQA
jgi:pimeloyl-ACP methyl ester carboxylesterase